MKTADTLDTPKKARTRAADWRPAFLAALADCGVVRYAAEEAGVSRRTAYRAREADESFRDGWDDALQAGADALEAEARRRALSGSDTLLIFLLKGARPATYRDNAKVDVTTGGQSIRFIIKEADPKAAIEP